MLSEASRAKPKPSAFEAAQRSKKAGEYQLIAGARCHADRVAGH
jgi:hypothetical protein